MASIYEALKKILESAGQTNVTEDKFQEKIRNCATNMAATIHPTLGSHEGVLKVIQDMMSSHTRLQQRANGQQAKPGQAGRGPTIGDLVSQQLQVERDLSSFDLLVADHPAISQKKNVQNTAKFRLPIYTLPRHVIQALSVKNKKQRKNLIMGELNNSNYVEIFNMLLFIEEAHRVIDMRRYDQYKTRLGKAGNMFTLRVPGLAEGRPSLMQGDVVLVRANERPLKCKGFIFTVRKDDIIVNLHTKITFADVKDLTFKVSFLSSRTSMRRCHYAVEQYLNNKGLELPRIVFPKANEVDKSAKIELEGSLICFNKKLNSHQKSAIENALRHVARPSPHLIWGPPGTGKTATLCELILQIHQRTPKTTRILACANSNVSADIIAFKLKGKIPKGDLIRLSAFYRMASLISQELIPLTKDMDSISQDDYKKCRVLVSTCVQTGALNNFIQRFDYVIIDEAGHAGEPESLIPITLLKPGGSVIMAGDFKQLGPISFSKPETSATLGVSLFERLAGMPLYTRQERDGKPTFDPRYLSMLLNNYRSDERLMAANNELFYNNELKFPLKVPKKFDKILGFEKQTVVHNVKGRDSQDDVSPSWYNESEVVECVAYVRKLYKAGIKPAQLGIITPYRRQIDKLRDSMANQKLKDCKVGTMEEFQGDEREVIIISTVRTSKKNVLKDKKFNLGFLFSRKRFNVATSRAKWVTIVVGDTGLLIKDPCWRNFIDKAQLIGAGEKFDQAMEEIEAKAAKLTVQ